MQTYSNLQRAGLALSLCGIIGLIWWKLPHPFLILPLVFLPLAAWVALKSSIWICMGFILFSFFRIHEAFPALYSLKIPQLLALGSLGVAAWHMLLTKEIKPYWNSHMTGFIVFFAFVTIGLMFASNRGEAIAAWTGNFVKITVMVFIIAWLLKCKRDFAICNWGILIVGSVIAIIALQNKMNGIGLVEGTRVTIGRDIGSMLGDPNDLALVLLFPTSFALAIMFSPDNKRFLKFLGLCGYILIVSAIIATQSRGGLLGIMSVTGVFAWQKVQNKVLLITLAGSAAMLLLALAGISDRASGGAAEDGIDASAMGRIYAWQAAWNMAVSNPFSGVGLNNFYVNYFFYSPHWDGKNHAVHSTWLGVLAETGFTGFIAFTTMVIRLLINNIKQVKSLNRALKDEDHKRSIPAPLAVSAQATLAGVIGVMVSGTFLTQGFTWPIYILFALSMAVSANLAPILASVRTQNDAKKMQIANGTEDAITQDKRSRSHA
ncbi:O-antigen ligase family protein [Marinomonas mediterranea]|uniref:O-antigen ligase family protein n=1 Tax=Marinomonas mediterranea TaxID=119864 RepID=UPI002349305D|nr:O-antigen ligase family protein [Marinomonas mediterranea]WCN08088.1 oligosaccharide repeat unit polymerase [Marinomonas mediterranea]